MSPENDKPPDPSQTSSHAPLEPISGALLFEQEARRRDALVFQRGNCATGCRELDQSVLVGGGFERGSVVGISAEEDEFGLVLGLQTISRLLVGGHGQSGAKRRPRAMIVTTMVMGALMATLRGVLKAEMSACGVESDTAALKEVLERVSISRVFDVSGLWDVFEELEHLPPSQQDANAIGTVASPSQDHNGQTDAALDSQDPASSPLSEPPSSLSNTPPWETSQTEEMHLPQQTPPGHRDEIEDSEEEDEGFSSPLIPKKVSQEDETAVIRPRDGSVSPGESFYAKEDHALHVEGAPSLLTEPEFRGDALQHKDTTRSSISPLPEADVNSQKETPPTGQLPNDHERSHPDIILITHMSILLSSLFHQRDKASAHQVLQLLASRLRYVTRSADHGGPLIIILNSTTSSDTTTGSMTNPDRGDLLVPPLRDPSTATNRVLDPTLRSIFNPPPLPFSGLGAVYRYDTQHWRRNKPSFGLIFSQLLDLHLLCTKIPRTRTDAEALFAPATQHEAGLARQMEFAWVLETLLDEIGVWEGRECVVGGQPRTLREQRWGAVELRKTKSGLRIMDAFDRKEHNQEIILAAGFGGRRV